MKSVMLFSALLSCSYTASCSGLSGIQEAVIQLEAEAKLRLLIE